MSVTVDANILVYCVDLNHPAKQRAAIDLIRRLGLARSRLMEQSVFEFLNAICRKLGIPLAQALAATAAWTIAFRVVQAPSDVLAKTFALLQRHMLSVWDARLIAACDGAGIEVFLTEDLQDGAQYGLVRVINPFVRANQPLIDALLPP